MVLHDLRRNNVMKDTQRVTESHIFLCDMASNFFVVSRTYANCCSTWFGICASFPHAHKTTFMGDDYGLQIHWAWAMQSHLQLIVWQGYKGIKASEMAVETHDFGKTNGGCLIRLWENDWMKIQELPLFKQSCHVKVASVLDDPNISNKILPYLHSNKWTTHLKKLVTFHNNELLLIGNKDCAQCI